MPTFKKLATKTLINLNNKLDKFKIAQFPKLITDKENCVVNISNKQVLNDVLDILSLGGKFNYN